MIYDLRFTNGGARLRRALSNIFSLSAFAANGERAGVRCCIIFALFALFCSPAARAATEIQYYLTITNVPAGLTTNLVANIGTASTRNWTNDPSGAPSTSIRTTNTTAASATNLYVHLTDIPVYSVGSSGPRLAVDYVSSNTSTLVLTAPINTNLTITFGGLWARGHYVTNTFSDASPILSPTNSMSPRLRTNAQNAIVNLLSDPARESSNSIPPARTAFRHYTDNTSSQTISNKTLTAPVINGGRVVNATNLTGTNVALTNVVLKLAEIHNVTELNGLLGTLTNGVFWSNLLQRASISNALIIGGNIYRLTNGYWTNAILDSPKATNLTAYGITAPGGGSSSEQFGAGAHAYSAFTTTFGAGAISTNQGATAVGYATFADSGGTAVGGSGTTASTNTTSIGSGITGSGIGNVIIGVSAEDNLYNNVILIGNGLSASAANQILIGDGSQLFRVLGTFQPEESITNAQMTGITTLRRIDLTARNNTGLANGYNSAVLFGTNSYVRLSGPTAAYTNAGFLAPIASANHLVHAQFDNPGLSMTLLNESGLDATAANRILTGTGALLNSTNNPVLATFLYDATTARWRILNFR